MKTLIEQLTGRDWVIFDTETTGLGDFAEIVQIGLLAPNGTVLMNQLVRPNEKIPADATRIHGITNQMVKYAPQIWEIEGEIRGLMENKMIVVYNAPFDRRMLQQSFSPVYAPYNGPGCKTSWPGRWFNNLEYVDVMIPYANYYGAWDNYHGNYRWQKLSDAMMQQRLPVINAHNAIGDCQMVLALLNKFFNGGAK